MQYRRKRASFLLAPLLVVFALMPMLSACGGSSNAGGGTVNLTFWSFNQQIVEQAAVFNQTHPGIHVNAYMEPSGLGQYYPKVLAAVRAGNAPDVALIEYQYLPTMIANGAIVDISKYGAASVQSQFDPGAWGQVTQGSAIYGYPQDTGPMGLFYNKAIFARAGISTPPATWADFAADAVKIHKLGPNYYITAFPPNSTGWYEGLNWQAGAQWFSIDQAKQAWKVNIANSASMQVANFWQSLLDQGLVSTAADFSNDWAAGLDKGTIASWISAVWGQGVVTSDAKDGAGKWAVAPIPQWQAGQSVTSMWGGSAISVISGTKHPVEANEFAQWYLTNAQSLHIGVHEIGWYPANLSARQSADVTSPSSFFGGQVVDQTFINETVQPGWLFPPDLTTMYNLQGDDFTTAVANHTSLAAAVTHLQSQVVTDLQSQGINVEASS